VRADPTKAKQEAKADKPAKSLSTSLPALVAVPAE